jgi:hypothetical protein
MLANRTDLIILKNQSKAVSKRHEGHRRSATEQPPQAGQGRSASGQRTVQKSDDLVIGNGEEPVNKRFVDLLQRRPDRSSFLIKSN